MREGADMLESRMVAHQRNYPAVMCFEDEAMLRHVNRDSMLTYEVDPQDGIESHSQRDYERHEGPDRSQMGTRGLSAVS